LHGFLLCYEKTAGIQAAENRSQKALAPVFRFCKSGIVTSLLLQPQFLEGPPPGGFSFGYVIGFPSNIDEYRMAGLRNRMGHPKSLSEESGRSKDAAARWLFRQNAARAANRGECALRPIIDLYF
jgi:hypothetical protein